MTPELYHCTNRFPRVEVHVCAADRTSSCDKDLTILLHLFLLEFAVYVQLLALTLVGNSNSAHAVSEFESGWFGSDKLREPLSAVSPT